MGSVMTDRHQTTCRFDGTRVHGTVIIISWRPLGERFSTTTVYDWIVIIIIIIIITLCSEVVGGSLMSIGEGWGRWTTSCLEYNCTRIMTSVPNLYYHRCMSAHDAQILEARVLLESYYCIILYTQRLIICRARTSRHITSRNMQGISFLRTNTADSHRKM